MIKNSSLFQARRQELLHQLQKAYPRQEGVIVLFGNFENHVTRFRQESSFYYYSGIEEPGAVLIIDWTGKTTVLLPRYGIQRSTWMATCAEADAATAKNWDVNIIEYLGEQSSTYTFSPLFAEREYSYFLKLVSQWIAQNITVFTLAPLHQQQYVTQQLIINRLAQMRPELINIIRDISSFVAGMRRKKSREEIEMLYKAVEITMMAQEAAARVIEVGKKERDIQAGIEYIFIEHGADSAFPSIVATGKNATVLHYHLNNASMKNSEVVIVDIGATYQYYCADLTRTYPVSGIFSKRQAELYDIVLETQAYIADIVEPGLWINNKEQPDKSLQHLAHEFLKEQGYSQYFMHGIGHFLGLDVHDVGDYKEPLQEGDVITIEPGIYIPQENIGIRIEDNYWIIQEGAVCLSDELPKDRQGVERMAQEGFSFEEEYEEAEE